MATTTNKKWVLVSHPNGEFDPNVNVKLEEETNYKVHEQKVDDTQVLVETHAFAVDAFIRTMLDEGAFHGTMKPGTCLHAFGYGKVVVAGSKSNFKVGSMVIGMIPVATYAIVGGDGDDNKDAFLMPLVSLPGTTWAMSLGLLGASGLTAYVGMFQVAGGPKKGDTVVVSAAAGAVGCVAAQLAKRQGAKVIGIAGGERKKNYLLHELGLDGAVDYKDKSETVSQQLDKACPDGIDFFFDNVGGGILNDVLERINMDARVVICGAVSQYSRGQVNNKRVEGPGNYIKLAERNATMKGFTVMHYPVATMCRALPYLLYCHYRGFVTLPQHVETGIESFPAALAMLFNGGHIGRLLVDVNGDLQK